MVREETAALLFLPALLDVQVAQYDGAQTAKNCGADSALDGRTGSAEEDLWRCGADKAQDIGAKNS